MIPILQQPMRHFDFRRADPRKPWESYSYSIFVEKNTWAKVTGAERI